MAKKGNKMSDFVDKQKAIMDFKSMKCMEITSDDRRYNQGITNCIKWLEGMPCVEPDVEQKKMGEWDMFEWITSVWYGKQCYFKEDYGMAYSRISHKTMPIQEAINEFMGEISQS